MNKLKINLPVLIIIFVANLVIAQLILTHRLATAGEKVREIEIEASRLEDKNELLEQETAQLGSLRKISEEAGKLGFVRNDNFFHLTPEIPVAMSY